MNQNIEEELEEVEDEQAYEDRVELDWPNHIVIPILNLDNAIIKGSIEII